MLSWTLRFLLLAFFFRIDLVHGCSCWADYPISSSYANAANIFIGQALRVQDFHGYDRREILFEVERKFKGNFASSNRINVSTPLQESACGLSIAAGQKWQIWASVISYYPFPDYNDEHGSEKQFLSAHLCSPSTQDLSKNIEFLLNPH